MTHSIRGGCLVLGFSILTLFLSDAPRARAMQFAIEGEYVLDDGGGGSWTGELETEQGHLSGSLTLVRDDGESEEIDVAATIDAARSILTGRDREGGVLEFDGGLDSGELAGNVTLRGRSGSWSGVVVPLPGTPATEVDRVLPPSSPPPSVPIWRTETDPNDPTGLCRLLDDPEALQLVSAGAEGVMRRYCERMQIGRSSSGLAKLLAFFRTFGIDLPAPAWAQGASTVNNRSSDTYPTITQVEPSIAVSSVNQDLVVVGFNDSGHDAGNSRVGYARSTNRGQTWTDMGALQPQPGGSVGPDPVVLSNSTGDFFFAALGNAAANVVVAKSTNGGITFGVPQIVNTLSTGGMQDKPEMAIDRRTSGTCPDGSNSCAGNIYVCWADFGNVPELGGIVFARSTNSGQSFAQINQRVSGDIFQVNFCSIAVGLDGAVYVAWWNFLDNTINVRRSDDGGASFPPAQPIVPVNSAFPPLPSFCCNVPALNGNIRNRPFPIVAADPLDEDFVYLVHDSYLGGSDVFFLSSSDRGITWSQPRLLYFPKVGFPLGLEDQFQPRIATTVWEATEPDTTAIKVMWYDRRNDPNNFLLEVSTGTSFDRGNTWQYTQWASLWSVPAVLCPQNFDCNVVPCQIGDYNGIANLFPSSVAFIGVWGDSRGTASGTPCFSGGPTESQDPDIRFAIGC